MIDDVHAVVVSWRTPALTERLLRHLARTWPTLRVVLVECGPEIHAVPEGTVTLRAGNLGYAGGNNLGMVHALESGARSVLLLNSDAFPLQGSIERLAETLEANPDAGACGAALVRWTGTGAELNAGTEFDWSSGLTRPSRVSEPGQAVDFPCGAMVLYRAEALRRIGRLDSNLFLFYEEIDWAERARAAGYQVVVDSMARAMHLGSVSVNQAPRAVAYYRARNRLWILRRYRKSHDNGLLLRTQVPLVLRRMVRNCSRLSFGSAAAELLGTADGMRDVPTPQDDPVIARTHQRWETREGATSPDGPFRRWLLQPEVLERPVTAIRRRVAFELRQRGAPASLRRDRVVILDGRLRVWASDADDIERSFALLSLYDHSTARAFQRLVPVGGTVVDAGAHVGQFTLLSAAAVGREGLVFAVEPQPAIHRRMWKNVALNVFSNVVPVRAALGASPGRAAFHLTENDSNSGLAAVCDKPRSCLQTHTEVELTTLDELVASNGDRHVDVIKMDVEGQEMNVLSGAKRTLARDHPAVVLEANEVANDVGPPRSPSLDLLAADGYFLYAIGPAHGEQPHLLPAHTGADLHRTRRRGRPLNVVALHPKWRGMPAARRWIGTSRRVNVPHFEEGR
jgi:FkbM family methyltransferase